MKDQRLVKQLCEQLKFSALLAMFRKNIQQIRFDG